MLYIYIHTVIHTYMHPVVSSVNTFFFCKGSIVACRSDRVSGWTRYNDSPGEVYTIYICIYIHMYIHIFHIYIYIYIYVYTYIYIFHIYGDTMRWSLAWWLVKGCQRFLLPGWSWTPPKNFDTSYGDINGNIIK